MGKVVLDSLISSSKGDRSMVKNLNVRQVLC